MVDLKKLEDVNNVSPQDFPGEEHYQGGRLISKEELQARRRQIGAQRIEDIVLSKCRVRIEENDRGDVFVTVVKREGDKVRLPLGYILGDNCLNWIAKENNGKGN